MYIYVGFASLIINFNSACMYNIASWQGIIEIMIDFIT